MRITDERMEIVIGAMLRAGVILSTAFVLGGGIWYLAQFGAAQPDYGTFRGEPAELRTITGILHGVFARDARSWIQFGLLILIATPVARVIFSVGAFAVERDRTYVLITLAVAAILLYSLFGQH
jgi:uncharacterized membrane protein